MSSSLASFTGVNSSKEALSQKSQSAMKQADEMSPQSVKETETVNLIFSYFMLTTRLRWFYDTRNLYMCYASMPETQI